VLPSGRGGTPPRRNQPNRSSAKPGGANPKTNTISKGSGQQSSSSSSAAGGQTAADQEYEDSDEEQMQQDETFEDADDEQQPPAKRQKRAWNTVGDTDALTYFKYLIDQIPLSVRHVFSINIITTANVNTLNPAQRNFEVMFDIKGEGNRVRFLKDFRAFWLDLGLLDSHIGKDVTQSFKFKTYPYIRHTLSIVEFIVKEKKPDTYESQMKENRINLKENKLPIGFYESRDKFLSAINTVSPTRTNWFSFSLLNHMILTLPEFHEIKFSKGLGEILGLPHDTWLMDNTPRTSRRVFTIHPVTSFYLYCSIIEPSITSNIFSQILYEIIPHKDKQYATLSDCTPHHVLAPAYKRLNQMTFNQITFKITDQNDNPIYFVGGETSILLHFRRTR
jgi:hypothetical protein